MRFHLVSSILLSHCLRSIVNVILCSLLWRHDKIVLTREIAVASIYLGRDGGVNDPLFVLGILDRHNLLSWLSHNSCEIECLCGRWVLFNTLAHQSHE